MWKLIPRRAVLAVVLLLCSSLAATADERPRIVAVNYALQFLAERLVGEDAEVVFPVPADVDPSFWRPSIADISMIQSADLILLNGAGFATWVDRVSLPRSRVVNTSAAISEAFITTETITHSHGDGGEHSHEGLASYTWLDPTLAVAQAKAIAAALKRRNLSPEDLDERLAALRADLEGLDAETKALLGEVAGVSMIATHPRYEYFARRYGLSIASLEWEAGVAPTAEEQADLARLVEDTGAGVLIWEAEPPKAGSDAARAAGLQSATFAPLAHAPMDGDFITAFRTAAEAINEAAKNSLNQ